MLDLLKGESTALSGLRFDYSGIDADYREEVQEAAIDIQASTRKAQENILTVGERLAEVKALLPHGQFTEWCRVEFGMEPRTAQRMMSVAERFGGKSDTVTLFSDSALYLLSAPSTPDIAVEVATREARSTGASPTKTRVQAIIREYSPPTDPTPPANGHRPPPAPPRAAQPVYISPEPALQPTVDMATVARTRKELAEEIDAIIEPIEAACSALIKAGRLVEDRALVERADGYLHSLIGKLKGLKARGL